MATDQVVDERQQNEERCGRRREGQTGQALGERSHQVGWQVTTHTHTHITVFTDQKQQVTGRQLTAVVLPVTDPDGNTDSLTPQMGPGGCGLQGPCPHGGSTPPNTCESTKQVWNINLGLWFNGTQYFYDIEVFSRTFMLGWS